jgi:hypothetical protein
VDGITVAGSTGTLLYRNVVDGNAYNGILAVLTTTLTWNAASNNGELGIRATPEVIDGGRNEAWGNGDPLQCLNVACK